MPGRKFDAAGLYRYGFNGKENELSIRGADLYDMGARVIDCRIARFLSVDPKAKTITWQTTYCLADNNAVWLIDFNGESTEPVPTKRKYLLPDGDDYKPFTTNNLITLGLKNGKIGPPPYLKPARPDIKQLGRIFQDAVLQSLGRPENWNYFPCVGCHSEKGRRPDAVYGGAGQGYDSYGKPTNEVFSFDQSTFVEVKFKGAIEDDDKWNPQQLSDMIKALGQMSGGRRNGVYDKTLKPADFGVATLVLVTPSNTLIDDATLMEAARIHNVNIWHRTVEQSSGNENVIRVSAGINVIYQAQFKTARYSVTVPVPTTLIKQAGDDATMSWFNF